MNEADELFRMKSKLKAFLVIESNETCQWKREEEVKLAIKELEQLGYEKLSMVHVEIMQFVKTLAFGSEKHAAYAILHDEAQSVWVDFFSVSENGVSFSTTNAVAPLIGAFAQRPTYFVSIQLPKVTTTILHEEFLNARPKNFWVKPTLKDLPAAYQIVCVADLLWQEKNFTKETADMKMDKIVRAAYALARKIKSRNPIDELLFLLRDLRLSKEANPRPPQNLTTAAIDGNREAIKLFLEQGDDINEETVGFSSPLVAAASQNGKIDVVNFLLKRGANPAKANWAWTSAIASAAGHGHFSIVERLLEVGVPSEHKKAALEKARKRKHEQIVQLLEGNAVTEENVSAKPKQTSLDNLIIELAVMGQEPVGKPITDEKERAAAETRALELLQNPTVIAATGIEHKGFSSFLNLAVNTGSLRLTEAVLETKPPLEIISDALIVASGIGQREIVKLLLKSGADPKFDDNRLNRTALIGAAKWGDLEIVKLLLEAGANPKARTQGGETPMTAASGPYRKKIEEALKQAAESKSQRKGSSVTMKGKRKANYAKARGVAEFQKSMGHPEWSLICVEASPETVAAEFAKIHPEAKWYVNTAQAKLTTTPPLILIFRLRGHAWTILVRTTGWLEMSDIKELPEDARKLSSALKTRAITYMAEDTSSCEEYELFKNGESIERANSSDEPEFKSSLREKPKFGDDFPEPTFSELGIYIPGCWMDNDGYQTKLVLSGVPREAVERLDCFEFKERTK